MYIRLNEELEKKVIETTGVDYSGELELKDIESIIKDLIVEYDRKVEELEEHKEHCREYHKERDIDYYAEYGISEKDFH